MVNEISLLFFFYDNKHHAPRECRNFFASFERAANSLRVRPLKRQGSHQMRWLPLHFSGNPDLY